MARILSFLLLCASMLAAICLIVLSSGVVEFGEDAARKAVELSQDLTSIEQADFGRVQRNNISGMEMVHLLQKYDSSGYKHLIVTKGNPEGSYSIDSINDVHSDLYVNPGSVFRGSVVIDENDKIYAVKFVEKGVPDVKFDINEADAVGQSMESRIQEAQYALFRKFLTNRVQCSKYLQTCSKWAEAIKALDSAELQHVYNKYSSDLGNQEEFIEKQILQNKAQISFYNAIASNVNSWRDAKWWEAIIVSEFNQSSEDLTDNDGDDGKDDTGDDDKKDDDNNWLETPNVDDNVNQDSSVSDSNLDIGSDDTDVFEGIPTDSPDPLVSSAPPVSSEETPAASDDFMVSSAPDDTRTPVPIRGPDS